MKQTFEKTTVAMIMTLVPLFVYGGDSAPFPLDTMDEPLVADSIAITYDASWIGGDASATAVIRDNGVEVRRTTGAGEFTHTPAGAGQHELTYTTLIGDVAQEEIYRAVVYKGKYTLRFDANGGEGTMADCEVVVEMPFTLPQGAFTKDGHSFLGWALTPNGEATLLDGDSTADIVAAQGETVTLYAVWHERDGECAINAYAIRFDANGGEGAMPKRVYAYGDDVTLPSAMFTLGGYTFVGWALAPDGPVVYADGKVVIGGLDAADGETKVLYVRWRKQYSVHFDANGGTGAMEDGIYYIEDTSVGFDSSLSENIVAAYSFDGDLSDGSENGHDLENHGGTFCEDRFGDANGALSFDGQGHSADSAGLRLEHSFSVACWFKTGVSRTTQGSASTSWRAGNALLFPPNAGNNAGVGLSVGTDGLSVTEHGYSYLPTKFTYDAAIGTDWNHVCMVVENDTAVRLYLNGEKVASGALSDRDKVFDVFVGGDLWGYYTGSVDDLIIFDRALSDEEATGHISPCSFSKVGHTFLGWATEPNGEVAYADGEPVGHVFNNGDVTNVMLYAIWGINQYTVSFDSVHGSSVGSITQNYGTSITSPANPTRTGYSFIGWQPTVPATMPPSNTTCRAQWSINQYTITFDSAGGNAIAPITQDYGSSVTPPAIPTQTGYSFMGWQPSVPATMPASNTTCRAQWSINQYTISFDSSGGSSVDSVTQDYDTAVIPPTAPTRKGYEFSGWLPEIPATIPARNIVCVAQWTPIDYTAHFDANGGTGEMGDAVYLIDDMSAADLGLTIRYYDISTTGYSTWTQSETAMTNYFANNTPTIVTNSLAFGDSLDSGIAGVERSSVNQFLSWGLNDLRFEAYGTTNRFHGKYAQKAQEYFAAYLTGFIAIPETGNYSFACIADDSEAIFIDGVCVCCSQWDSIGNGSLELTEGSHSFSMGFYEGVVGHGFAVQWKKPGDMAWSPLPQSVLYQSIPSDSLPSCSFVKTGHSFLGWATEPNGEVAYIDREPVGHVFNDGDVTNVTLHAVWGINQYTVSFDSSQGSPVASITQNYGTSITPPPNPTRTGYSFLGWQPELPTTMPASNTVCVAQWELLTLSLDVTSAFGTASPDIGRHLVSWGDRMTVSVVEPSTEADLSFAYYLFTNGFDDSSGNGYDLNNQGGMMCEDRFGNENGAISFDGQRHCASNGSLVLERSFTVAFWFQTDVAMRHDMGEHVWAYGNYPVYPRCEDNGKAGVGIMVGTDGFAVVEHASYYQPIQLTWEGEIGNGWNNVCLVVDNNATAILYLNGVRVASGSLSFKTKTFNLNISSGGDWGNYTGKVDDFIVVNRALKDADVMNLYSIGNYYNSQCSIGSYFSLLSTSVSDYGYGFRQHCTGWTGTGSVPASGTGTATTFTIQQGSSITWNWERQIWHECTIAGDAAHKTESGWKPFNAADNVIHFSPNGSPYRYELSGDTNGVTVDVAAATVTLPTDRPRSVVLTVHVYTKDEVIEDGGTPLTWIPTPSGTIGWSIVEDASADDGFSLRSGAVEAGEISAVESTVEGAGTLSFDWRISSARGHFARFYVDGVQQKSITRTMDWATVTATLDDGPHTLRWAYEKGTGETGGEDAAFLDNVVWTPLTLADALDTDAVVWSTDGAEPWIPEVAVTADAADAARSGAVTGLDVSALTATVLGAGTLTWSWMGEIAGNAGVDVFLDGEWCDSVWLEGETDWKTASLAIAGAGTHAVRFEFWNGGTADTLSDYAVIDQVSWSGTEARTLAVASAFGTASPAAGTHVLARGGQVAASAAAPEPANGTRLVCKGWTGTGSVPATGSGASVVFALNEDSSIEWNWRTDYWTEITVSGGTCAFAPQWVAAGTQIEVAITASAHVPTVTLSGDTAGATLDGTTLRFIADRPRTIHVEVQEVPVPLTVASAHGSPFPAVGTHALPWGTAVSANVTEPEPANGELLICTGWIGTGSVPASGTATNVTFTLEERSSITWTWTTNVWVELACAGAVEADFIGAWVAKGGTVVAHWSPTAPYVAVSLSGDTTGVVLDEAAGTLAIPADGPRALTLSARALTLAGALDAEGLAWATTTAAPWFPQETTVADGEDAAQSGGVAGGGVSALETTLVAPGTLTWSWRLDAANGGAALRVLLDGEPAATCVAGTGWTGGTLAIDAIGAHTVRFEFSNDGVSAEGCRAFLDQMAWTGDTDVMVDGWFDVNFADPGYRAGSNWGDVSQVTNPGGTWELGDGKSLLADASGGQERRVELCGTTGIVYRATHSSETGADIRIEGRIRMTIGICDLSEYDGVIGLSFLYLDEDETQAAPYGIVDGVWAQLQPPLQPLVDDTWHDYVIELDLRSELAPRIRYTIDGEALSLASGGEAWIPISSAPDGISEMHVSGLGAIGNFRGIQTTFAVPIADLEMPDLSGPGGLSFGMDGSGNPTFNVRVANPVPGVYYTAFVADTLAGPFLADAASRLAEPSDATITFALAAGDDRPSRFVRIVASTDPFAAGDPLPEGARCNKPR